MVDIISMVKHAARQEEPILTAAERVDRAMGQATAGKTFTQEQTMWLDLIRAHMVQNLTIDLSDFEAAPIFATKGGLVRARKIFTGDLEAFIEEFNYAMAA